MSSFEGKSETLLASLQVMVSQRLQTALAPSSLLLLHRSQWRCLANSYSAVIQALIGLSERACSVLGPLQQESMWRKLTAPLNALHQAVLQGEACLQELLPSSCTSKHSWLLEKALKLGMSSEVVDLHLHRLLWASSVVREQILRCAPFDDIEALLSEHTRELCDIWSHVDAEDDLLLAQSLLKGIMGKEEGDTHQLARFILQKLSCSKLSSSHKTHGNDLPSFLWVDPKDLTNFGVVLGEGGYGKVQEVVWSGGRFAVKDFFYVGDNVAFGREAIIQAQLHHSNVIPLVCCAKNTLLKKCSLIIELMQQDLRVLMMQRMESAKTETPFPLSLAVDLMLQISLGMEYLHSDGLRIMHRDLKSSNILVSFSRSSNANGVTSDVHLKLADFGMSKAKHASSRYTTRQVGATPWRAPEVFETSIEDELEEGDVRYTNKADVYSFAMVCYEILTGKFPFEGTSMRSIKRKVLAGQRPSLPRHCPPALSSYLERCWHTDPNQRPTFTQICRMLRYFKACAFLRDHDHDQDAAEHNNWLLHPLNARIFACIDNTLQSCMLRFADTLRPQVLVIPLEMYCCRVALQQFRDESVVTDQCSSWERGDGIHEFVAEGESGSVRQGYFDGTLKWLKKLSWMRGTQRGKAGLPNALVGLQMGNFTYKELHKATDGFSSVIGCGGPVSVHRGQLKSGQRIAVKVVYFEGNFEQQSLVQELRIASQLQHQNIVPLLGWCLQGSHNHVLLVYEYMPNGDLAKHIFYGCSFGWQQRYKVVGQVAAALRYLHQDFVYGKIVHRNVKPSKILLDSEWNARLGGCGEAILLAEEGHFSPDTDIVGTVGFCAPEYLQLKKLSPSVDVYSFGVTVLTIAAGRSALFWNSEGKSECWLPEWVGEMYRKGEVLHAADVQLAGSFDESEMRRLLMLGLACTHADPGARPGMEQVLRILSTASDPPPAQDTLCLTFPPEHSRQQSPASTSVRSGNL